MPSPVHQLKIGNDWHTGEMIHWLTTLSALLHDLGKASTAFQMRLRGLLEGQNGLLTAG